MAFHGLFWSFLDLFGNLAQFLCQHQNFGKGSTFFSYDKQLFAWIRNFTIHFTVTLMKMWTDSKQFSLSIFFDKVIASCNALHIQKASVIYGFVRDAKRRSRPEPFPFLFPFFVFHSTSYIHVQLMLRQHHFLKVLTR